MQRFSWTLGFAFRVLTGAGCVLSTACSAPPDDATGSPGASAQVAARDARVDEAPGAGRDAQSVTNLVPSDAGSAAPADATGMNAQQQDSATDTRDAAIVSASATADAGEKPAQVGISAAYDVLTRGRISEVDEVLEDLDKRVQQDPDDGYANFYGAAFRLWKLAEGTNSLGGLVSALSLPEETIARFDRAQQLMPDDFRVPGFFGLALLSAGALGADQAMIQRALSTLDTAIGKNPAYGYFLRATATSGLAKDDPLFPTTIRDMQEMAKACLLQPGDEQVAYRYPDPADKVVRPRVCSNAGVVPHVWEGTFISFGDMALKSGWDAARVRALYRTVQASPNYATWPFASVLEQRLRDVETNAAAFGDANPFNDPAVWGVDGHICVGCHQER